MPMPVKDTVIYIGAYIIFEGEMMCIVIMEGIIMEGKKMMVSFVIMEGKMEVIFDITL